MGVGLKQVPIALALGSGTGNSATIFALKVDPALLFSLPLMKRTECKIYLKIKRWKVVYPCAPINGIKLHAPLIIIALSLLLPGGSESGFKAHNEPYDCSLQAPFVSVQSFGFYLWCFQLCSKEMKIQTKEIQNCLSSLMSHQHKPQSESSFVLHHAPKKNV